MTDSHDLIRLVRTASFAVSFVAAVITAAVVAVAFMLTIAIAVAFLALIAVFAMPALSGPVFVVFSVAGQGGLCGVSGRIRTGINAGA
jgi:hypothetical protein